MINGGTFYAVYFVNMTDNFFQVYSCFWQWTDTFIFSICVGSRLLCDVTVCLRFTYLYCSQIGFFGIYYSKNPGQMASCLYAEE